MRRAAILNRVVGAGIAGACALLVSLLATSPASAASNVLIGIDMQPATNDPASLGRLQPCVGVDIGETFTADIFIANAESLTAWELRLDYNPQVVAIESADYNQLLLTTQPAGTVFPSLFEEEQYGRQFMAATEINGSPDTGSGVLAHLTLKATGEGSSTLRIATDPLAIGPRITGAGGAPIGDSTGDGVWDGAITSGEVVVGDACTPATPIPTPPPANNDGSGLSTGGDDSGEPDSDSIGVDGNGNVPDGSASGGSTVEVINGGSEGDAGGEDTPGGSSADGSADADGSGDRANPSGGTAGSTGMDGRVPLILGVTALAAVAVGTAVLFLFRRRPTL